MRLVPTVALKDNTEVALNIYNYEGTLLLKKGSLITKPMIEKLLLFKLNFIYIIDEFCFDKDTGWNPNSEIYEIVKNHIIIEQIENSLVHSNYSLIDLSYIYDLCEKLFDIVLPLYENFKIIYSPINFRPHCIVTRNIYIAMNSVLLGVKLNLPQEELEYLFMGSLLKDVALYSKDILKNKKLHPYFGYKFLHDDYELDEKILMVVLQHHEKLDGSGYPFKLRSENISRLSKIVSLIETFYDIRANQNVLRGRYSYLRKQFEYFLQFDKDIFDVFSKNVEIYNKDMMVKLSSGDNVVVIGNNSEDIFRPIVKVIVEGKFSKGTIINLMEHPYLIILKVLYFPETEN